MAGVTFAVLGIGFERLASTWPEAEARHRPASWRTLAFGAVAAVAGYAVTAVSHLPPWATIIHLVMLGLIFIFSSLVLAVIAVPVAVAVYIFEVGIVVTIQAFVFALLSAIYIGGAIEPEH